MRRSLCLFRCSSENWARPSVCWSCPASIVEANLFCGSCKRLQPPAEFDYFKLLGLRPSFDVDEADIESRFRALQRKLHPDNFHERSPKERRFSQGHASLVNNAFRTLQVPLTRARYLLERRGMDLEDEARSKDMSLLMEVMELRERVEEAENEAEVEAIQKEVRGASEEVCDELSRAFGKNDFELARKLVERLSYLENVKAACKEKFMKK